MAGTLPITPEWLKRTYLKGVVTTENGREFPRDLYVNAIRSAAGALAAETGVTMERLAVTERHDLESWRAAEFQFLTLRKVPIDPTGTIAIRYKLGTNNVFEVPSDWILRIVDSVGQLELLPLSYTGGALIPITQTGQYTGLYSLGAGGRFPGWYEVDYVAGFPLGDVALHCDALVDLTETYEGIPYSSGTVPAYGHRLDVRGAPTIHRVADTANDVVTHGGAAVFAGTTLAEACVQANALRAAYEAHRRSTTAHTAADTANALAAPAAADLASLTALVNDLLVKFARHMATAGTVHGQADTTRPLTAGAVRTDYVVLPFEIRHALGMMASMGALNPAGDLIAGAGIANYSVSVDGLSQSIGTTASATNAGYGARIIQYAKDLKPLVRAIKAKYRGSSFIG